MEKQPPAGNSATCHEQRELLRPGRRGINLLFVLLLSCSACSNRTEEATLPDIPFDKAKWVEKAEGRYTRRKQMLTDLLQHYHWVGITKDSVIRLLGQPGLVEENLLWYEHGRKRALLGLGTTIEALVFELAEDSTVKAAELRDSGWD